MYRAKNIVLEVEKEFCVSESLNFSLPETINMQNKIMVEIPYTASYPILVMLTC